MIIKLNCALENPIANKYVCVGNNIMREVNKTVSTDATTKLPL